MNTKRSSRDYIVRAAMTLLVMLLTSATAWAEKYIDADGIEKTQDGVIVLSSGSASTLSTGWYVIDNDIEEPIKFDGNVNLIIQDDKNVTITGADGITVTGSLTIYGQSKGTGLLRITANGTDYTTGFGIYAENGEITINGGALNISTNQYGICTNKRKSNLNYDITINGGRITVTATGENGIDASGNITINGGNVNANGKHYGIAAAGTVTLNGGIVTANGTGNSSPQAGISAVGDASTIYLDGAIVIANSYSGTVTVKSDVTYTQKDLTTKYYGNIDVSTIGSGTIFPTTCFGIASGNDGSKGKPYTITSPEELQLLACLVNEGNTFTSKYIQLSNDLDMYGIAFRPIGVDSKFCGNFDGGGYIISNLYINIDDTCIGLFGLVGDNENNATIQNITISNATITGKEYVGGIVGSLDIGSIKNCFVINSKITSSNTDQYYGAIVGYSADDNYLSHNYYGNSTVNGDDSSVGCGTNDRSSDVTTNDGAVSATFLSESETVPRNLIGKVVFRRVFTGGKASTICLPFAYTPQTSDGTFHTFTSVDESKWEATMTEVNGSLEANKPYIFVPNENQSTIPVLFHGTAVYDENPSTQSGNWIFKGTYDVIEWRTAPKGIYGFSAQAVEGQSISQGQFVKVGEYVKIRSLRAYLQYTGSNFPNTRSLSEEELPDRILVRLVGNGETSIGHLNMKTGEVTFDNGWYTLEGVRLSGKPAKHGIYVNNGRKHIIK